MSEGVQGNKNPKLGCLAGLRYDQKLHLSSVWRRGWGKGRAWAKKDLGWRLGVSLIRQKQLGRSFMVYI